MTNEVKLTLLQEGLKKLYRQIGSSKGSEEDQKQRSEYFRNKLKAHSKYVTKQRFSRIHPKTGRSIKTGKGQREDARMEVEKRSFVRNLNKEKARELYSKIKRVGRDKGSHHTLDSVLDYDEKKKKTSEKERKKSEEEIKLGKRPKTNPHSKKDKISTKGTFYHSKPSSEKSKYVIVFHDGVQKRVTKEEAKKLKKEEYIPNNSLQLVRQVILNSVLLEGERAVERRVDSKNISPFKKKRLVQKELLRKKARGIQPKHAGDPDTKHGDKSYREELKSDAKEGLITKRSALFKALKKMGRGSTGKRNIKTGKLNKSARGSKRGLGRIKKILPKDRYQHIKGAKVPDYVEMGEHEPIKRKTRGRKLSWEDLRKASKLRSNQEKWGKPKVKGTDLYGRIRDKDHEEHKTSSPNTISKTEKEIKTALTSSGLSSKLKKSKVARKKRTLTTPEGKVIGKAFKKRKAGGK